MCSVFCVLLVVFSCLVSFLKIFFQKWVFYCLKKKIVSVFWNKCFSSVLFATSYLIYESFVDDKRFFYFFCRHPSAGESSVTVSVSDTDNFPHNSLCSVYFSIFISVSIFTLLYIIYCALLFVKCAFLKNVRNILIR